ncbi:hypothetical protein KP509_25G020000 [Ceratopteris richardii]|uniref:Integrase catalytic domain-containing protein n=1 Tax=Ceratopteris richardii TaxID=49495 RepID=A0A8T2RR67_CERRI|nr:hypothetical protein KP509_25G020000 [Ceratopteris richardii]
MSTAFHPQTDGETERVNRVLEDMLRMYVNDKKNNWTEYLPLVEYAYNSAWHSSIKMTSFEAMYGYNCLLSHSLFNSQNQVEISKQLLENMDLELNKVRKNMKDAQKRQKLYHDLKKRPLDFRTNDLVFLKVSPYKSNLVLGKDCRLSPRYAGPFKILKKIGSVAYLLDLPNTLKIHPVFHV